MNLFMEDNRILDQISFEESIIHLIDNYLQWSTEINTNDCVFINKDLEVSLISEELESIIQTIPIISLIREVNGKAEADFEKIADLAQQYFFIR